MWWRTEPLKVGNPSQNIHQLATVTLNRRSPIEKVMPKAVVELLQQNDALKPSGFEKLRAKSLSLLIGGAMPFAITALFGGALYGSYQLMMAASLYDKIALLAKQQFDRMTQSALGIASSTTGIVVTTFILTRPQVYDGIASLLGTFMGNVAAFLFTRIEKNGYEGWYESYRFEERQKSIDSNMASVVHLLTDTYNDIGDELKEQLRYQHKDLKGKQQLKTTANTLKKRIPIIHFIMQKNGIRVNQCDEITLKFEKAINAIQDS